MIHILNTYEKFAFIYDELIDDIDYEKWGNFINKIILDHGKKVKSILEIACGTGKLTLQLSKICQEIDAFDISADMLSIAYNKFQDNDYVNFYNLDMVDFDFNKEYDLIICGCDSINYILDTDDLDKVFSNVRKHLKDDGLFIFDINSYEKIANMIGNNIFYEDRGDIFYLWDSSFDKNNDICDYFLTFFILKGNSSYEKFQENHTQRAYKTDFICEKLVNNGFDRVYMYDDYTFKQIDKDTQRVTFVASISNAKE
ncbi:MAG: class I SAM-dependent methyltransferase [Tissierellales bacterium]|nr:class I SAM-dependent methyltransferase [Tissierellales bacterium]